MFSLENKAIVVTGGTAGIGEGCVRSFVEAGAKVVVCGRRAELGTAIEAELRDAGYDVTFVQADLTIAEDNKRVIDTCIEKYGRVDGVVCNAGGSVQKWTHQYSVEEWKKTIDLNFNSAFILSKYALPYMMKQKTGSIIFMSSATQAKPQPFESPYSAPKAAMAQLARHISLEYCRYGIRANTIAPGATFTPILAAAGLTVEQAGAMNAANKCAFPKDIANIARFLLADETECITGTTIYADYGYACGDRYDQLVGLGYYEEAIKQEDEAYLSIL